MKDAKPDRYQVSRRGTPDPERSQYYVLDVVHDLEARVVLRRLVRNYRSTHQHVKADELERFLNETEEAQRAAIEARTPKTAKKRPTKKEQRVAHA